MTINRLAKSEAPPRIKRTPQEWCDRGNDILAGRIPMEHGKNAGQFMRRDDVRWVVRNNVPTLEQWS